MSKFRSSIPGALALAVSVVLIVTMVIAVTADDGGRVFLPLVGGASTPQPSASPSEKLNPAPAVAAADVEVVSSYTLETPDDCFPLYAPTGDRYLCRLATEEGEFQMWLASESAGLMKPVLDDEVYLHWAYDDEHVIYVPRSDSPLDPRPYPVYLLNLETGEKVRLGETVQASVIQVTATGYITFLDRDSVRIVNPILDVTASVPLVFDAETARPSSVPLDITPEPEPTWPAWLLVTPEVTATVPPETAIPVETPTPEVNYGWAVGRPYVEAVAKTSPDGSKVALYQENYDYTTLSIIDVASGERRVITHNMPTGSTNIISWSPDSSRLVYGVDSYGYERPPTGLWMVSADGSQNRLLWQGSGRYRLGKWLTDSLVLFGIDPGGYADDNVSYRVINVDGGEDKEIMIGGTPASLVVSQDGQKIIRQITQYAFNPIRITDEEVVVTILDF